MCAIKWYNIYQGLPESMKESPKSIHESVDTDGTGQWYRLSWRQSINGFSALGDDEAANRFRMWMSEVGSLLFFIFGTPEPSVWFPHEDWRWVIFGTTELIEHRRRWDDGGMLMYPSLFLTHDDHQVPLWFFDSPVHHLRWLKSYSYKGRAHTIAHTWACT